MIETLSKAILDHRIITADIIAGTRLKITPEFRIVIGRTK
jgi:hypothetical protein